MTTSIETKQERLRKLDERRICFPPPEIQTKSFTQVLLSPASESPPLVKEHDTYLDLLIYANGCGYPIEYLRMNTATKVLGWVHHLTTKQMVTREHIRQFIEVAEKRGVKINHNA